MNRQEEMRHVLNDTRITFSDFRKFQLLILACIGVVGFFAVLAFMDAYVAWQALLINTLFFTGISYAGLMYSVIFTITDAYWGRSMKRIAEAMAAFMPIGMILFFVLFLGVVRSRSCYPYQSGMAELSVLCAAQYRRVAFGVGHGLSVCPQFRPPGYWSGAGIGTRQLSERTGNSFTEKYRDNDSEMEASYYKNKRLAPWLGVAYALLSSLIAFDWMMSIDQEWFSTMFGVQYLVSNLMGAGATLIIMCALFRKRLKLENYITLDRFHDICKLTFALGLLWTYMIFSQVIIIWYANLPEETPYLMMRLKSKEWGRCFG
ncbi:hypothetical protein CHS0354_018454 [Potamilus streckersoni]|uniref:Uncharacterized protein n=1 Tax=Potamilus streckersoni TaxID=2493646 RepID=A0AAE0TAK7_9BIVA|nr:hypothetical protein CHS0354_018454 [Potamilus streckersoni]